MSVFRLTDVSDTSRESKDYWEHRLKEHEDKPTHGLYLSDYDKIEAMDRRNIWVIDHLLSTFDHPYRPIEILEAACGWGRYEGMLYLGIGMGGKHPKHKFRWTGFDLADTNVERARDRSLPVFQADMATVEIPPNIPGNTTPLPRKFDLIFMVAAWSSIEQKSAEVITHLKTLLNPGGKIAVLEESLYMVIESDK